LGNEPGLKVEQVFRILDRDKTVIRYNAEWLAGMKLEDLSDKFPHPGVLQVGKRHFVRLVSK